MENAVCIREIYSSGADSPNLGSPRQGPAIIRHERAHASGGPMCIFKTRLNTNKTSTINLDSVLEVAGCLPPKQTTADDVDTAMCLHLVPVPRKKQNY